MIYLEYRGKGGREPVRSMPRHDRDGEASPGRESDEDGQGSEGRRVRMRRGENPSAFNRLIYKGM